MTETTGTTTAARRALVAIRNDMLDAICDAELEESARLGDEYDREAFNATVRGIVGPGLGDLYPTWARLTFVADNAE